MNRQNGSGRRIGVFTDISIAGGFTPEQAEEIAQGAMALDLAEAYAMNDGISGHTCGPDCQWLECRIRREARAEGFALCLEQAAQAAHRACAGEAEEDGCNGVPAIRALTPDASLAVVPRADLEKVRAKIGEAIGDGHNLKAFAGTMLRWNEPGVDFSDEARRVVEHATKWHAEIVAIDDLLKAVK